MTYRMRITETSSGRSVEHDFPGEYSEGHWVEGNMGCDCNRRTYYIVATTGQAWPPPDHGQCGEGAFSAEFVSGDVRQDEEE